jgi:acyl carrier protein
MITTEKKIKTIISEKLGVSLNEINPETNLVDDLGASQVEIADILTLIEKELAITIPEENKKKTKIVGRIIRLATSQVSDFEDESK